MDKHMKKACFLVAVLLITVMLYGCAENPVKTENAVKGYMDLSKWDFEKSGITKLNGQWEFYWNKLLTPEDLAGGGIKPDTYYIIPGAMDKMEVDATPLSRFGHGTLRLRVKLPDRKTEWGLKTHWLLTSSAVWINGVPTVSYFENEASETEIILQVANYYDTAAQIDSLLMMALYHSGLFAMKRKDRSVLCFGLFCLLVAVRASLVGEALLLRLYPRMPWELFSKTVLLTLFIGLPVFAIYMRELFPNEISVRVCKIVIAASVLLAGTVLMTTSNIYDHTIIPCRSTCS